MHDRDIWEKRSIFWVAKNTPSYEPHPSEAKEPFYGRIVVPLIKRMLAAQGIDFTLEGVENLPATGPALLAFNHTGYFDFIFGGTVASLKGHRLVRFMAKKEIFDVPVVGLIMRGMRHISVDRAAGAASLDEAVRSLREGNLVGIFPEATISRAFEIKGLKSGAVRIAAQSGAPLIPVAIWGSQRVWTKDHPRQLGRKEDGVEPRRCNLARQPLAARDVPLQRGAVAVGLVAVTGRSGVAGGRAGVAGGRAGVVVAACPHEEDEGDDVPEDHHGVERRMRLRSLQ